MRLIRNSCALGLALFAGGLWAQDGVFRHNLDAGVGGVFPLSGYLTSGYASGPAWRPGYELRLSKLIGAEMGWTQAWLPGSQCNAHWCTHPRETLQFLDYSLRAHAVVAGGRIDLSAGVGGGYVWYEGYHPYANGTLFQYSAKAAFAVDQRKRVRVGVTVRTWRDLGRPTQEWLSATGSVMFGIRGQR